MFSCVMGYPDKLFTPKCIMYELYVARPSERERKREGERERERETERATHTHRQIQRERQRVNEINGSRYFI